LVVHVTACPGSVFPPASLTVARREKDTPTSLRAVAGLTLTAKWVGSMGWSPPQAVSTRMPNQTGAADVPLICDPPEADTMSRPHCLGARTIAAGLGNPAPTSVAESTDFALGRGRRGPQRVRRMLPPEPYR